MTLCWPWPAEQPSSEVENMKAGEGRRRGGGKLSSPWKSLPKAFRPRRNKSRCARAIPTQALTRWEGFSWGAFQSQLQPHTTFQRAHRQQPFHLLVLSCFALQHSPVCTSAAGSSSHLNFNNSGKGKASLSKDASFVAFLVPGVVLVAVVGIQSPSYVISVSGNGQSDPSFKQEGRRWDLMGTGGRAARICFATNSWKSSVELWNGTMKAGWESQWGLWREMMRNSSGWRALRGNINSQKLRQSGFFPSYFLTE